MGHIILSIEKADLGLLGGSPFRYCAGWVWMAIDEDLHCAKLELFLPQTTVQALVGGIACN